MSFETSFDGIMVMNAELLSTKTILTICSPFVQMGERCVGHRVICGHVWSVGKLKRV